MQHAYLYGTYMTYLLLVSLCAGISIVVDLVKLILSFIIIFPAHQDAGGSMALTPLGWALRLHQKLQSSLCRNGTISLVGQNLAIFKNIQKTYPGMIFTDCNLFNKMQ